MSKTPRTTLQPDADLYHSLLNSIQTPVLALDADMTIRYCNAAYADFVDQSPAELIGHNLLALFPQIKDSASYQAYMQAIATGQPQQAQGQLGDRILHANIYPTPWGVISIAQDLTDHQRLLHTAERQALQLQTVAAISRAASSILNSDELVQNVVNLVRERFDLYYVGLFLVDQSGEWAVLRAGTGPAGEQMTAQGHRLRVGGDSMIGQCLVLNQAGIALDTDAQVTRFDNPLLPLTRSELALPLSSRDRIMGAMTVQSQEPQAFAPADIDSLQVMADQLATAISNARLFEERTRRTEELAALRELSLELVQAQHDLSAMLNTISRRVMTLLDADGGGVWLWDRHAQDLVLAHTIQVGDVELTGRRLKPGEGLAGRVLLEKQLLAVADYQNWPERPAAWADAPFHAALGVPLLWQDQAIGVLAATRSESQHPFDATDQRLAELLAGQIAVFVANARLFQERERHVTELAIVNKVGQTISAALTLDDLLATVYDQVSRLFDTTNFYVAAYQQGSAEWIAVFDIEAGQRQPPARFAVDAGLTGHIIRTGQPILLGTRDQALEFDRQHGLQPVGPPAESWLGVPLLAADQVMGVMVIQSYEQDHLYTSQDQHLFVMIANQVAIAFERLRLLEETRRRAQQLEVVNEIGQAVSGALALDELLETIYQQVSRLFDTTNFYIALYYQNTDEWESPLHLEHGQRAPVIRRKVGAGLTGHIIRTRQPLLFTNPEDNQAFHDQYDIPTIGQRARSWMGVPLVAADKVVGVMAIQSYTTTQLYNQADLALLGTIADQVATVVANLRLLEETRHRVRELDVLNDIGRRIDQRPAIPEFLQWAAARIPPAMQYPDECRVAIALGDDVYGAAEAIDLPCQIVQDLRVGDETVGHVYVAYTQERQFPDGVSALLGDMVRRISGYIESRHLFQERARRTEELTTLNTIASAASRTLELRDLLDAALKAGLASLNFDAGLVSLYDEESGRLYLAAQLGVPEPMVAQFEQEDLADTLCGHVFRTGETLGLADVRAGAPVNVDGLIAHGLYTYAGAPLTYRDRLAGTICFFNRSVRPLPAADLALLTTIGQQIGAAVEHARLFDQTQTTLTQIEALYQASKIINTATSLDDVLHALIQGSQLPAISRAALSLFNRPWVGDDRPEHIETVAAWDELAENPISVVGARWDLSIFSAAHLLRPDEPLAVGNVETDARIDEVTRTVFRDFFLARSSIMLPLVAAGQWIGLFNPVMSETIEFNAAQLRQLLTLASQAATAVQSILRLQRTQAALAETEALYQTSRAINEATTAAQVGTALMAYAASAGNLDAARFLLLAHDAQGQPTHIDMQQWWRADGQESNQPIGTRLPLSDYPLADLMDKNQPILVEDVLQDPRANDSTRLIIATIGGLRAFAMIPIATEQRWIGMLFIARAAPSSWPADLIRAYHTLASQAAVALASRHLLAEAERRAHQEQVLREITAQLQAAIDADTIVRTTVRRLGAALNRPTFVRLGSAAELATPPGTTPPADGSTRSTASNR